MEQSITDEERPVSVERPRSSDRISASNISSTNTNNNDASAVVPNSPISSPSSLAVDDERKNGKMTPSRRKSIRLGTTNVALSSNNITDGTTDEGTTLEGGVGGLASNNKGESTSGGRKNVSGDIDMSSILFQAPDAGTPAAFALEG